MSDILRGFIGFLEVSLTAVEVLPDVTAPRSQSFVEAAVVKVFSAGGPPRSLVSL